MSQASTPFSGPATPGAFDKTSTALDVFDVKGHLEELCEQAGVEVTFTAAGEDAAVPFLHPRSATWLTVMVDGAQVRLGVLGELHPDVAAAYELAAPAVVFDLDLDVLSRVTKRGLRVRPLPRFPSVRRDFALVVDAALPSRSLVQRFRDCQAAKALLEDVEIFDVYQGKGVADGKKSVAVSVTLRAADRTLAEADVQLVADALLADVKSLGAEVRG